MFTSLTVTLPLQLGSNDTLHYTWRLPELLGASDGNIMGGGHSAPSFEVPSCGTVTLARGSLRNHIPIGPGINPNSFLLLKSAELATLHFVITDSITRASNLW